MNIVIRPDRKDNKCAKCGTEMREQFAAVYSTCDACFSKTIDAMKE